jgi:hypothetical protein
MIVALKKRKVKKFIVVLCILLCTVWLSYYWLVLTTMSPLYYNVSDKNEISFLTIPYASSIISIFILLFPFCKMLKVSWRGISAMIIVLLIFATKLLYIYLPFGITIGFCRYTQLSLVILLLIIYLVKNIFVKLRRLKFGNL